LPLIFLDGEKSSSNPMTQVLVGMECTGLVQRVLRMMHAWWIQFKTTTNDEQREAIGHVNVIR